MAGLATCRRSGSRVTITFDALRATKKMLELWAHGCGCQDRGSGQMPEGSASAPPGALGARGSGVALVVAPVVHVSELGLASR
jgi:hypothetical protein